ncbi:MAG TPA: hypothetical protein VKF40_02645 [Burkholderiales bacterium]|nr:hypothetical protein [Burkholderiales bacterium]
MDEERDRPNLLGQMAGIIAMMSALVKTLPPSIRKRLRQQTQVEFESLLAAMSTASAAEVHAERESVEWMRDLFLRRIEQPDSKQSRRRVPKAAADSGGSPAPDKRPRAEDQPGSTKVDFEF